MNLRRALLIIVALFAIAFGSISFGTTWLAGCETTAGACARCGDGVCAKSCESKYSCPQDCGGTVGSTSAQAR